AHDAHRGAEWSGDGVERRLEPGHERLDDPQEPEPERLHARLDVLEDRHEVVARLEDRLGEEAPDARADELPPRREHIARGLEVGAERPDGDDDVEDPRDGLATERLPRALIRAPELDGDVE